jgi:hypothetical protein
VVKESKEHPGVMQLKVMTALKKRIRVIVARAELNKNDSDDTFWILRSAAGLDTFAMVILTILSDHYWEMHHGKK